MKIVQFSRLPLIHLRPTFFHPFDLGRPISNNTPPPPIPRPLQMKTTNNAMVSLKDGFTVQYQGQKEDFFGSACLVMVVMVRIQFSLIIIRKDWKSRTVAIPPPPTSDIILFLPYPQSPHPLKVNVIFVSPLRETAIFLCQ